MESKKYYIYYHIDPRNGFPFYIGKGSGRRAFTFYNRSKFHTNKVKAIKKAGLEPIIVIGNRFDSEEECFKVEKTEILVFKKLKLKLTNIAEGGNGGNTNKNTKAIIYLNENRVFNSIVEAANYLKILPKRINDVLRKRKNHYKGNKFKYLDEKYNLQVMSKK